MGATRGNANDYFLFWVPEVVLSQILPSRNQPKLLPQRSRCVSLNTAAQYVAIEAIGVAALVRSSTATENQPIGAFPRRACGAGSTSMRHGESSHGHKRR